MTEDGQVVDEDCVRTNLQDFDLSEIVASGEPTSEMIGALLECFDLGS